MNENHLPAVSTVGETDDVGLPTAPVSGTIDELVITADDLTAHSRPVEGSERGTTRVSDAAAIAGIFVAQAPLDILNALAALSETADAADTACLTDNQFAVLCNATELVALMSAYIPQDNAPDARLRAILERVTNARHALVISDGGASNQFEFLLRRLGYDALIDQLPDDNAAEAVPPDEMLDRARSGGLTPEDIARYPDYFISGPGREFASVTECPHRYKLTASCPNC
jgi:hypothetical protein